MTTVGCVSSLSSLPSGQKIGPVANNAASGKLARLVEAGPGDRSIVAWNAWREEFDLWNKVQSQDAVLEGPILAQKYPFRAQITS